MGCDAASVGCDAALAGRKLYSDAIARAAALGNASNKMERAFAVAAGSSARAIGGRV